MTEELDKGNAEPDGPREVKVELERGGGAKGVFGRWVCPREALGDGDPQEEGEWECVCGSRC